MNVLRTQHVAGVENISGQDLRDGRLKAILALFFALSRHKQATKQQKVHHQQQLQQLQQQHLQQNQVEMTPNRYVAVNTKARIAGCALLKACVTTFIKLGELLFH